MQCSVQCKGVKEAGVPQGISQPKQIYESPATILCTVVCTAQCTLFNLLYNVQYSVQHNVQYSIQYSVTMCGKAEGVSWWMESLGKSQGKNPRGRRPQGFWPWDFPRDFIHHDTPNAFPHIFILLSSWISKEGFLSLLPNPTCPYTILCSWSTHIGRVKSQNTGPGVERMYTIAYCVQSVQEQYSQKYILSLSEGHPFFAY